MHLNESCNFQRAKKYCPDGTSYQVKDKEISEAHVVFLIRDASGSVQFKLPKWELGTASTEWTLAPEDLSSYQKITFPQELFDLSPNNRNLLVGSDFSKVTATPTISISNGVATMTGAIGVQNKIQLTLSNYALQNMCGKEIVGSMYGAGTNIAYGTTNPWIGAEIVINYDDGSGDYFNVWGDKLFPSGTSAWSKNEKAYQVNDTSPASFLGGTWMRQTDRFLYCSTPEEMANGTYYGGSKTKTISQDNLPNVGLYTHGYYTVDNNLDGSTVAPLIGLSRKRTAGSAKFGTTMTSQVLSVIKLLILQLV